MAGSSLELHLLQAEVMLPARQAMTRSALSALLGFRDKAAGRRALPATRGQPAIILLHDWPHMLLLYGPGTIRFFIRHLLDLEYSSMVMNLHHGMGGEDPCISCRIFTLHNECNAFIFCKKCRAVQDNLATTSMNDSMIVSGSILEKLG
ncbi:hypothetical protein ABZP36_028346 [Zizania latifolia]